MTSRLAGADGELGVHLLGEAVSEVFLLGSPDRLSNGSTASLSTRVAHPVRWPGVFAAAWVQPSTTLR